MYIRCEYCDVYNVAQDIQVCNVCGKLICQECQKLECCPDCIHNEIEFISRTLGEDDD